MTNVAAELWGCPGLSVAVHRYNNGIGTPFWQLGGLPTQEPRFTDFKYLISERDARFVVVVNILTEHLPITNILIGDILSVDLYLDGFHVSDFLWSTERLIGERTASVGILSSTANPATGVVKTFAFSEPTISLDGNNNNHHHSPDLGIIKVVISHARGYMINQGLPLMEDHTRSFPDNSTIPQWRFPPDITPHVITFHRGDFPARPPAGLMKTRTILRPCSFIFRYGTRETIELLTHRHIVVPGDDARVIPAPALHPPQAVRGNNLDVAARNRQNPPGLHGHDPRLADTNDQMIGILRNYARDFTRDMIDHALSREALLYPEAHRGYPVAGPSNVIPNQYPSASRGPPPATGLPPNTGLTRAAEIDELRQFSNGLSIPRPNIEGHPKQPGSHAGTPPIFAYSNLAPGVNTTTARTTASSPVTGHDAGTAVPAGVVGRRRRAAPRGDSQISARGRGRGRSTGPADRLADMNGFVHTQQALTITSATGGSAVASGVYQVNRSGKNIMNQDSTNVTNSAHPTVTGQDSTHTAVSATTNAVRNLPVTAPGSAALASGGDDSDVGHDDVNSGSGVHGANASAIAEGVTHGASAGEDATNATKIDDQDSRNADVPAAQDVDSASNPTAIAPDGSTGNFTVLVNDTVEPGSESGHSPPHKKQRVDDGGSGGTHGDDDA